MRVMLHINGKAVEVELLERKSGEVRFVLNGREYRFLGQQAGAGFVLDSEAAQGVWRRQEGALSAGSKGAVRVQLGALEFAISKGAKEEKAQSAGALSPTAPMPGLVRKIWVKKGDKVKAGQALAVLEAMKLQLTLSAGGDGVVEAVLAKEGELVSEGAELVRLKP